MLRAALTFGLTGLLLGGVFHVDLHYQDSDSGYGFCDISCDEKKHHSMFHECEKCLNKNTSLIKNSNNDLSCYFSSVSQFFSNQDLRNYFLNFSTYGRPPPNLI